MAIISTIPESEASGLVAELYDSDLKSLGSVASHTRVMAVNPEAMVAFENLVRAITASMDLRRYELVTLAAARGMGSVHCRLAHGRKSLGVFDEGDLIAIARDPATATALSAAEIAMMAFAEKVAVDPASMTDDDSRELRELGFSDREIVDITLAAAVRRYYSSALQALSVEVDAAPDLSVDLQRALLEGIDGGR
ncbi:carboxymuconolactone decarboxylase family protein [Herbiconiux solani]|uniref:carboxymuconolactone decarboxylase family protein n=1 Tax=Herbiconiux solani TaxID=661329 RepID=UPI000826F6D3|nr:carboxymuconolactone decarboxylase [Herbiconiux solani]